MNTDKDAWDNADWVIEEARRQIDHQLTTASEIDGRALGLLGLIGGAAGLFGIFADLNLETSARVVTTAAVVVLGVLSTAFLAWSIWPETGISFGPEVDKAVALADELDGLTFRRSEARSMRDAMAANRVYLAPRQGRLQLGTFLFVASVVGIVLMIASGAFMPTKSTSQASPTGSPAPSVAPAASAS
jgi:hypothetical protein